MFAEVCPVRWDMSIRVPDIRSIQGYGLCCWNVQTGAGMGRPARGDTLCLIGDPNRLNGPSDG